MADDQNPGAPKKEETGQQQGNISAGRAESIPAQIPAQKKNESSQEVGATDLLSLWGGGVVSSKPITPASKPVPETPFVVPKSVSSPLAPASAPAPILTPISTPTPPPPASVPIPVSPSPKPQLQSSSAFVPQAPKPVPSVTPRPAPQEQRPESVDWFKSQELEAEERPPAGGQIAKDLAKEEKPILPKPAASKPVLEPKLAPEPKPTPLEPVIEGEIVSPEEIKPKKKPEEKPAAVQTGAGPKPPLPAETIIPEEGFISQFDEFLAELNLSRKHIFMGLGCFVFMIILVIGGFFGFRYFKNREAEPPLPAQPSEIEQPADTGQPPAPADEIKPDDTGISAAERIGTDIQIDKKLIGETGIYAAVSIGTEFESATPLSDYIYNFRRLQNAYETDVDEILDKSTNRRARLQAHLAVLRRLNTESTQKLQQIAQEIASVKAAYEPLRSEQEVLDKNFFEQLGALNGQTADDILNEFTGVTREIVTLRARFQALQKLQSFYEQALPKVARLIRDIELNEEALVSGLKIYDVRGSDLKLIVPVTDETLPKEQLESSSLPLIPIHPSQVQTGRDYITQPGGGF